MDIQRILFLGLGGAGQRHLRILKEVFPKAELLAFRRTSKTPLLNADFTVNESDTVENFYSLSSYSSLEEAFKQKPDLTVISTPTSTHMDLALKALRAGSNLLVEKPFAADLTGFEALSSLALENDLRVFTSFQRREHPLFKRIKAIYNSGEFGKIISANFNISSYVPNWHKYEDFKELYACKASLGGGVLLTEIHETDLSSWFFGKPLGVFCSGGNFSENSLDIEDSVNMTLLYSQFNVQLNISFMQKLNKRELTIYGSEKSIEWNEAQNELVIYDHLANTITKEKSNFSMNDMFQAQANNLVSESPGFNLSDIKKAKDTVEIILAAKASMAERRIIELNKE